MEDILKKKVLGSTIQDKFRESIECHKSEYIDIIEGEFRYHRYFDKMDHRTLVYKIESCIDIVNRYFILRMRYYTNGNYTESSDSKEMNKIYEIMPEIKREMKEIDMMVWRIYEMIKINEGEDERVRYLDRSIKYKKEWYEPTMYRIVESAMLRMNKH